MNYKPRIETFEIRPFSDLSVSLEKYFWKKNYEVLHICFNGTLGDEADAVFIRSQAFGALYATDLINGIILNFSATPFLEWLSSASSYEPLEIIEQVIDYCIDCDIQWRIVINNSDSDLNAFVHKAIKDKTESTIFEDESKILNNSLQAFSDIIAT